MALMMGKSSQSAGGDGDGRWNGFFCSYRLVWSLLDLLNIFGFGSVSGFIFRPADTLIRKQKTDSSFVLNNK